MFWLRNKKIIFYTLLTKGLESSHTILMSTITHVFMLFYGLESVSYRASFVGINNCHLLVYKSVFRPDGSCWNAFYFLKIAKVCVRSYKHTCNWSM